MTTLEREPLDPFISRQSAAWHRMVFRGIFHPFNKISWLFPFLHTQQLFSNAFWDFPHHENPIRMEISHIFDGCWVALKSLAWNTPFRRTNWNKDKVTYARANCLFECSVGFDNRNWKQHHNTKFVIKQVRLEMLLRNNMKSFMYYFVIMT